MLSNHCLQYCGDARGHIKEAYRVLQIGGTIGVGVVGRKKNSPSIFLLADAMKEHGIEVEYNSTMCLLGEEGVLANLFKEEGFNVSKAFYHTMNVCATKEEFHHLLINYDPCKEIWDSLTNEMKDSVYHTFEKLFEERYGAHTETPCELEALIVVAHKSE
jgi:hypothetical protein